MTFSLNFTHQMIGGEEGVDSQHLSIMGIISFINPFILKFWVLCISCVRNCADKGRAVSFEMTFPVFLFNVSQSFKTSRSTWRNFFLFFELVDSWSLNYYGLGWPGRTRGCATCGCAEWGFIYLCHLKKTKQWFLLKITWEPHKYIWGGGIVTSLHHTFSGHWVMLCQFVMQDQQLLLFCLQCSSQALM